MEESVAFPVFEQYKGHLKGMANVSEKMSLESLNPVKYQPHASVCR